MDLLEFLASPLLSGYIIVDDSDLPALARPHTPITSEPLEDENKKKKAGDGSFETGGISVWAQHPGILPTYQSLVIFPIIDRQLHLIHTVAAHTPLYHLRTIASAYCISFGLGRPFFECQ